MRPRSVFALLRAFLKTLPRIAIATLLAVCTLLACTTVTAPNEPATAHQTSPLRVLLITGGGWHDYERQTPLLIEGLNNRLPNLDWSVWHEGDGQPTHTLEALRQPNWAAEYDLVIHNTAFGRVEDSDYVASLVDGHGNTPAVLLHSAIHSYRYALPAAREWFAFTGVQSMWHEQEREFLVEVAAPGHAIMQGFPPRWTTPVTEELYVVEKVCGDITPLAVAHGVETGVEHPVVWTHEPHGTRVFATTLGHNAAMFEQAVYLDMIARGIRWAVGDSHAP